MRTNELQSIEEILKRFEKIPTISKEKYAKSKIDQFICSQGYVEDIKHIADYHLHKVQPQTGLKFEIKLNLNSGWMCFLFTKMSQEKVEKIYHKQIKFTGKILKFDYLGKDYERPFPYVEMTDFKVIKNGLE